jgi:hypothetical protein
MLAIELGSLKSEAKVPTNRDVHLPIYFECALSWVRGFAVLD